MKYETKTLCPFLPRPPPEASARSRWQPSFPFH